MLFRSDYVVNYKKFNDKWYYDYARFELGFSAKYKGKWVKNKYSIVSELAVTDFNNNLVSKPNSSSKLRYKDIMASKVQDFADSNFWGSYNIIEPDDAIENIINRIIRQLKLRVNYYLDINNFYTIYIMLNSNVQMIPLPERLRPKSLEEYVGQEHLIGKNAILRRMIDTGNISSFILWGPPGVGKTTLARIIASKLDRPFFTLSAML